MSEQQQRWALAIIALRLLKADTQLKGLLVASSHGPVQHAFTSQIHQQFPITAIPVSVSSERLSGGLDISQTLAAGKPVHQPGLLHTPSGALLVNGAERLNTLTTSALSAHLDNHTKQDTVLILMDESTEEEPGLADTSLSDRLALMIELPSLPIAELQALLDEPSSDDLLTPESINAVYLADSLLLELTQLAQRLGVESLRALLFAVRAARGHAALNKRSEVTIDDAAIAAQLVLAPRAISIEPLQEPAEDEQQDEPSQENDEQDQSPPSPDAPTDPQQQPPPDQDQDNHLEDIGEQLLEAAMATLPQDVIASLVRGQNNNSKAGRDKTASSKGRSGRPAGVRRPRGGLRGQRLNIVETLKAAAPKQRLRGNDRKLGLRLQVRVEDFRISHYKQPTRTTTVFVVDASGSAALHRLAEAKGAVELILAECYVRRDRVALISFRGTDARLELPPTRSLVRAKRELANLPGGGGTPLAAGLNLAHQVAQQLKQAGETPVVVVMTDGKANIASDGEASRPRAMEDAHLAARQLANAKIKCLFIDTAPRARPQARELSDSLQARYLPLPSTDTHKLPELIRA